MRGTGFIPRSGFKYVQVPRFTQALNSRSIAARRPGNPHAAVKFLGAFGSNRFFLAAKHVGFDMC